MNLIQLLALVVFLPIVIAAVAYGLRVLLERKR